MGIRAGLTEIPADVYAKVKAGGNIDDNDLKDRVWTSLDKTWHGFHLVFKRMDMPLKFVVSGDFAHSLGAKDINSFEERADNDFYLGFMSPPLVRDIAASLSQLSNEEVAQHFAVTGIEFDAYFQNHLNALIKAYSQAAKNGNALYICIA